MTTSKEPAMPLPTLRLLMTVFLAGAICAGGWYLAVMYGPWEPLVGRTGLIGAGMTTLIALAGVLVMSPWKTREMSWWMTMWLGGTVLRIMVTPAVAFVLYSAASLDADALALSVAMTYFVVVVSEASVLSHHVKGALPSP